MLVSNRPFVMWVIKHKITDYIIIIKWSHNIIQYYNYYWGFKHWFYLKSLTDIFCAYISSMSVKVIKSWSKVWGIAACHSDCSSVILRYVLKYNGLKYRLIKGFLHILNFGKVILCINLPWLIINVLLNFIKYH